MSSGVAAPRSVAAGRRAQTSRARVIKLRGSSRGSPKNVVNAARASGSAHSRLLDFHFRLTLHAILNWFPLPAYQVASVRSSTATRALWYCHVKLLVHFRFFSQPWKIFFSTHREPPFAVCIAGGRLFSAEAWCDVRTIEDLFRGIFLCSLSMTVPCVFPWFGPRLRVLPSSQNLTLSSSPPALGQCITLGSLSGGRPCSTRHLESEIILCRRQLTIIARPSTPNSHMTSHPLPIYG